MNFHSRNLLLKAVLGGLFTVSAVQVDAGCHGRSGGGSYGGGHSSYGGVSSRFHSTPVYHPPVYRPPVYTQPSWPQPVYAQPQPVQVQPQPVYSQTQQPPQFGSGQQGITLQQGTPAAQPFPTTVQPAQGNTLMGQTGNSFEGQTPGSTQTGAALNVSAQAPNTGTSVNSSAVDAQQSALQALGGFAPPQTTVQPATSAQSSLAGSWTASLPNGARVQLMLQADGNFSWTAINKDGQSSVFKGSYAIENGSLSLTRSNDAQRLEGSMTINGANTFTFKLSSAQSSSLDFVRS
jgi:hypothetical protein